VLLKLFFDYVTRRFNASSAGMKKEGWTYAGTAALRDHQIQLEPESAEMRPPLAGREDGSGSARNWIAVKQSNLNQNEYKKYENSIPNKFC
jgi:hypothetical protein